MFNLRKDVDYAIDRTRHNEKRLDEQSKRVGEIIDRFNAVIDYVLDDARCPMCGGKMDFLKRTSQGNFWLSCFDDCRLKCQNDGFEIRCRSLKGCIDQLREIESKAKEREKSGE